MTENNTLCQYVKQKTSLSSILGRVAVLIIFASILAILSQTYELQNYMLILAIGMVLIASALMRNFSSEYEYCIKDGEFYIDRIYGVSKHKELFSFSLSDVVSVSCDNTTETKLDFSSPLSEFLPITVMLSDKSAVVLSLNDELKAVVCGGEKNDF